MGPEGNGKQGFRVIISGKLRERVFELAAIAKEKGEKQSFLSILQSLVIRLQEGPQDVGEPEYWIGQFHPRCPA
jgi:hypothetical protein